MAIIGGPPRLAVSHQRGQVRLERSIIELVECLGIIKIRAHRIGRHAMLVQHVDRQRVGPPILVLATEQRANLDLAACTTAHGATFAWFYISHDNAPLERKSFSHFKPQYRPICPID